MKCTNRKSVTEDEGCTISVLIEANFTLVSSEKILRKLNGF